MTTTKKSGSKKATLAEQLEDLLVPIDYELTIPNTTGKHATRVWLLKADSASADKLREIIPKVKSLEASKPTAKSQESA